MAFLAFVVPILISVGVSAGLAWLSKAINPTPQSGRLGQDDFHTLESAYTLPLPKCWGTERVPGNITWIGPVREHKYNVGGGLLSDGVDVFFYTQDVEYSFTLGPAKAFVKIFLGDKVIYDQSGAPTDLESGVFGNNLAQAFFHLIGSDAGAAKDRLLDSYELFLGTESQEPSQIVSAVEGGGTVPADRGIVKIVLKNLNLTKLGGNALPAASAIIQFADYTPVSTTAIAKISPTVTSSSGPIYTYAHTEQSGLGESTVNSGLVEMWHSCGLCDWVAWAEWSGFSASEIPTGTEILGIYPACEARAYDLDIFNVSYGIGAAPFLMNADAVSPGETTAFAPPANGSDYVTVTGSSIGTDVSIISTASIYARFFQTLSMVTGSVPKLSIRNPRLEVHYSVPLVPPTGTTLGLILADLLAECGFTSDQYTIEDTVALIPVKGFKTEQKAIRDVIRELMEIYPFDGYEGDGKLNIVYRGGDTADTIGEDDLVLSGDGDNAYRISEPITQEDEIPMKTDVHYADIDRDFQDNVQHSKRIVEPSATMESITVKSVSTNVVMNANEAAQAAERINWEPWANKRGGNFQLMPKKLLLDPSDKVQVNYKSQTLIQRILNANLGAGLGFELATVSHDSDIYASDAIGVSNGDTFPVPLPSSADPGLVNVPVIFEPPAALVPPGAAGVLWIAVSGASEFYGGCEAFVSVDGTNYTSLGDMAQGITGFLMADYPVGSDPDTTDTLSVDLTECSGVMPSRTRSTADGFFNLTYVGVEASPAVRDYELVCPTTANPRTTDNLYDLVTYIRRGAQGSTILDHPTGSRFADLTGALRMNLSPSWVGITLYFKFAAYNLSHVHPTHQQASDLSGCVVYPYSPVGTSFQVYVDGAGVSSDLIATIDGAGPFTLSPGV